jgi:hypothetical protein
MAYHSKEAALTVIVLLLLAMPLGCAVITVLHIEDIEDIEEPEPKKVQQKKPLTSQKKEE